MLKDTNIAIGERVRRARTETGFSREQLAEMLEISALFLGYIECGQRGMSITTLQKLCRVLNVSADYILFGRKEIPYIREQLCTAIEDMDEKYYPLALDTICHLKKTIAVIEKQHADRT